VSEKVFLHLDGQNAAIVEDPAADRIDRTLDALVDRWRTQQKRSDGQCQAPRTTTTTITMRV